MEAERLMREQKETVNFWKWEPLEKAAKEMVEKNTVEKEEKKEEPNVKKEEKKEEPNVKRAFQGA